jgi:4-amino-4-deoxy-L-arabinose transferase-like glycosyltransferase
MRSRVLPVLLVVLCGVVLRLPAVRVAILNEDEALYATAAAAMQAGAPPYVAGVESKPPGVFYIYRAAFALVGRYDMKALHALTIPWVLATALFVALIAGRVAGRRGALLAALFYLVYTTVQEPKVLATQCELLYSLPLAAAAWLLVRGRAPAAALAGVLCALATLIKPTAVSLVGAGLLWLVVVRPLQLGRAARPGLARAAALAAGFVATWTAAWAYFSHLGVWDDLVYWAFRWTTQSYIPTGFATFSWLGRFVAAFGAWAALAIVPIVLALRAAVRHARNEVVGLTAVWTFAAAAMVCLGGRFYDHYFPALVTPLAVLAGVGAAGLDLGLGRWPGRLIVAGTALPALACFIGACAFYRTMELLGDPRQPYAEVARYVEEHTAADDRVFVWGYYPLIYVAADRLAATRFVGCHYVTGYAAIGLGQKLPPEVEDRLAVPGGLDLLVHELEARRAELVIDTAPANLHFWARYPLERYPTLAGYVAAHYEREAVVGGNVVYRRKRGT